MTTPAVSVSAAGYHAVGKGHCRQDNPDANGEYPHTPWDWFYGSVTEVEAACNAQESCLAYYLHSPGQNPNYQVYCSKKEGLCTESGSATDVDIGRQGGPHQCMRKNSGATTKAATTKTRGLSLFPTSSP